MMALMIKMAIVVKNCMLHRMAGTALLAGIASKNFRAQSTAQSTLHVIEYKHRIKLHVAQRFWPALPAKTSKGTLGAYQSALARCSNWYRPSTKTFW